MRVCDTQNCGRPAKAVAVDISVATPHADDIETASVEGSRYTMDLCETCLQNLHVAVGAFEPEAPNG